MRVRPTETKIGAEAGSATANRRGVELTETKITAGTRKAAESKQRVEVADAALPGLRLHVTPVGHRTWVLGMRDRDGRARRSLLGEFPAIGIPAARELARKIRHGVRYEGADPIVASRARRAVAAAAARCGRCSTPTAPAPALR
jgi:hypothetical protein